MHQPGAGPAPSQPDLAVGAITMQGGRVAIPTGPGLGVDVNRDVIERYRTQ